MTAFEIFRGIRLSRFCRKSLTQQVDIFSEKRPNINNLSRGSLKKQKTFNNVAKLF